MRFQDHPFGMMMPNRKFAATGLYRYGFNGKENDNEVKGEGNSLDFGARTYDPRIARWSSTDKLQGKYPFETPYGYTLNCPLQYNDQDGKDIIITVQYDEKVLAFLSKTFEDKVNIKAVWSDALGTTVLTFAMKPDKSFTSATAKRAFDYVKGLENNHNKHVTITVSQAAYQLENGGTRVDAYKTGELFIKALEKLPMGLERKGKAHYSFIILLNKIMFKMF